MARMTYSAAKVYVPKDRNDPVRHRHTSKFSQNLRCWIPYKSDERLFFILHIYFEVAPIDVSKNVQIRKYSNLCKFIRDV